MSGESVQLVGIDQVSNQFYVTEEGQKVLESVSSPVYIITIAGLYRTGKSFLVNKLLKESSATGFKTGSTTNPVTKGLYIWSKPIQINNINYLLIDSEGIGSCQQELSYDTNLLLLIFLISNTVVYNSFGAIDEQALGQLQVVLNLKNCIEKHGRPKFVWVLRDFALQLIDKEGNQLTPNQYLDKALEEVPSYHPDIQKKNQIRRAIKENLGERSCYTLVRPTVNEKDLTNLHNCKIRTEFIGQIQQLKDELFPSSPCRYPQKLLSGKLIHKTLEKYVQTINRNQLPEIENVWQSVIKINNDEIFFDCCSKLKKRVSELQLPMSNCQLKRKLNEIENQIYNEMEQSIQDEFKVYHKKFIAQVDLINKQMKSKNENLQVRKIMNEMRSFVKQNIKYEAIQPNNITTLKNIIDRMKVKAGNCFEAYDYIIQTIIDVHFVVEKKSIQTQQELNDAKLILASQGSQKKHNDLVLINMKKQYHEALKTIAKLQESQGDVNKEYAVLKTQNLNYEQKVFKLEGEIESLEKNYQGKIQELQNKLKVKNQQYTENVRKLRQQNKELNEQITNFKNEQIHEEINSRKEVIFQEKIEGVWEKFTIEKNRMLSQMTSCKDQLRRMSKKCEDLEQKYHSECQKNIQQKMLSAEKQINFENQLNMLKKCINDTKNSYAMTFSAMKTNQKVFKSIQSVSNMELPQKRSFVKCLFPQKQNAKEVKQQQQINRIIKDYEDRLTVLNRRILQLEEQLDQEKIKSHIFEQKCQEYEQKCKILKEQIIDANEKFNGCLKDIQIAKEKQRNLYEESIVRLLTNIEKRGGSFMKS